MEKKLSFPRERQYVKDDEIISDPNQGQTSDDTFINQVKYIKDLLKRFGMKNSKPYSIPMSTSTKLDKDEGRKYVDS